MIDTEITQAISDLPLRESLSEEERIASAAVCVVRAVSSIRLFPKGFIALSLCSAQGTPSLSLLIIASDLLTVLSTNEVSFWCDLVCALQLEFLPPVHCPPGKLKTFVLLHTQYYHIFITLTIVTHIWLAFFEPTPRYYGSSASHITAAGFLTPWKAILTDFVVVLIYAMHCLATVWVEGVGALKKSSPIFWMVILVGLLGLDSIINASTDNVRPFRFLRPFMYTMLSSQQAMMVKCCEQLTFVFTLSSICSRHISD
jgi:hypothetical protein